MCNNDAESKTADSATQLGGIEEMRDSEREMRDLSDIWVRNV